MALSAFADKTAPPSAEELKAALGRAHAAWARLIETVAADADDSSAAWGYTSASSGWGLRLKSGDRILLYMTPQPKQFLVSFALGERAVAAAKAAGLPAAILKAIDDAPKYAEGRGVRIEVRRLGQVKALAGLARIKRAH